MVEGSEGGVTKGYEEALEPTSYPHTSIFHSAKSLVTEDLSYYLRIICSNDIANERRTSITWWSQMRPAAVRVLEARGLAPFPSSSSIDSFI